MKRKITTLFLVAVCVILTACGSTSKSAPISTPAPTTQSFVSRSIPMSTPDATYTDGLKSDGKIHVYIIGEGEKVYTPESSFINYIIYYADSSHLIINMNGKDYVFANITWSLWYDFLDADSKGSFYNERIKGNSDYLVNDYSTGMGDLIVLEYIDLNGKMSFSPNIKRNSSLTISIPTSAASSSSSYTNYYSYADEYSYCESCEERFNIDDMYYVERGDYYICEGCFDDGDYRSCDGCGEIYYIDNIYELGWGYFCEWCLEEEEEYYDWEDDWDDNWDEWDD